MSKQPKVLQLADELESNAKSGAVSHMDVEVESAAALRRQHALIADLVGALTECAGRLHVHMIHSEDLVAHMRATAAVSKAKVQS